MRIYNDDKAVIESFCDYVENSPSHFKDAGCLENIFKRVRHFNIDLDLNHRPRYLLEKVKSS